MSMCKAIHPFNRRRCLAKENHATTTHVCSGSDGELHYWPVEPAITPSAEPTEQTNAWTSPMRTFDTGATRNNDAEQVDYEGFLSPLVLQAYARYMHTHRTQADGALRDSDNWQKGIPKDAYIKSGLRHVMDWWLIHRGLPGRDDLVTALCAVLFNVMGYLHETLKAPK